jgi:hypothetical protein
MQACSTAGDLISLLTLDVTCLVLPQRYSNVAMALSDMDATYFELEQAALERSLEPHSNFEQGKKQKASSSRRRKHGRDSPPSHVAGAAASGGPISSELSPQSVSLRSNTYSR